MDEVKMRKLSIKIIYPKEEGVYIYPKNQKQKFIK